MNDDQARRRGLGAPRGCFFGVIALMLIAVAIVATVLIVKWIF